MGLRLSFLGLILFLNIATGGDQSQQVTGLIGRSIDLSIQENFSHPVIEVVWKFGMASQRFKIAEIKNNKLEIHFPQFENRLEESRNGMELRIKNGTFNDRGNYIAEVTLSNSEVHYKFFSVHLYEPVPVPSIRFDYENGTSNRCNVKLHCSVPPNTTYLSYAWKFRPNGSDYQPYNSTGDTIQMPLKPEYGETEVLCTVKNPADSKNDSVTLKPCDEKACRLHWPIAFPAMCVLSLSVAFIIFKIYYKKAKPKLSVQESDHSTYPVQETDPKGEVRLQIYEKVVKHPDFISIHQPKQECKVFYQCLSQDENMALNDQDFPSISSVLEDS